MKQPTPYAAVNAVLEALLVQAQSILQKELVGMYLYGSLALGDFNPENSDVDFLAVTQGDINKETIAALTTMHKVFATGQSKWHLELEGSYIPQNALRRYDAANACHPHIDRGADALIVQQHDVDWIIQRDGLYRHGITLFGPPIQTLLDPVSPAEVRAAIIELMRIWWTPMLDNPEKLAHNGYRAYAAQTMLRVLYTLERGAIVSKPESVRWAKEALGAEWQGIVEKALAWDVNIEEVQALIRLAGEHGNE